MNTTPVIPRIEDLPYISSPPIEFYYRQTASLAMGSYTWTATPTALTVNRPVMISCVYYFRSVTLTADVEELDFTSNISTVPKFQMYLKSRAKVPLFREPIYMPKFLQNFDYRMAWMTRQVDDQLLASFAGVITQGASLIGKNSITLTAVISAQEIVDENFVKLFEKQYPGVDYVQ